MAKFDVHRGGGGTLLLDCQNDLLQHLNTRLVVPLAKPEEAVQIDRRLTPVLEVEGAPRIMLTHFAAAVPLAELGARIGSVRDQEYVVAAALDMLISGY
ncbi:toxin CcdB [Sphingomonas sp. NFR04]|uniref:CcdB family protein n=1 Tax=Sphingomonas sp. NFR04 TaxID=1566283 RepID=UPI0008DF52C7|nr:CcdB family protein [Sphingomonas sp. NFR04]SFJ87517.1 toxin CcdB [Sphingomonas sp. NFR04]